MARWNRRETLLALSLYFETPFGKQHKTHPPIIALAERLGRTPSSVGMKLCNFTSLDPVEMKRGIKGLTGASKLDRSIWNEFHQNPTVVVLEIESLLERSGGSHDISENLTELKVTVDEGQHGTDVLVTTKQRRHQNFFRRVVLGSHGNRCCITGNPIADLLRASHIVPWSQNVEERLNPRNGLCLSATFDVAFDRGLVAVDDKFRVVISDRIRNYLPDQRVQTEFIDRDGSELRIPEKNIPDQALLHWHRENVFL